MRNNYYCINNSSREHSSHRCPYIFVFSGRQSTVEWWDFEIKRAFIYWLCASWSFPDGEESHIMALGASTSELYHWILWYHSGKVFQIVNRIILLTPSNSTYILCQWIFMVSLWWFSVMPTKREADFLCISLIWKRQSNI